MEASCGFLCAIDAGNRRKRVLFAPRGPTDRRQRRALFSLRNRLRRVLFLLRFGCCAWILYAGASCLLCADPRFIGQTMYACRPVCSAQITYAGVKLDRPYYRAHLPHRAQISVQIVDRQLSLAAITVRNLPIDSVRSILCISSTVNRSIPSQGQPLRSYPLCGDEKALPYLCGLLSQQHLLGSNHRSGTAIFPRTIFSAQRI